MSILLKKKILWPHNFDPSLPQSGVFVHVFAQRLRDLGCNVDLLFLGDLRKPDEFLRAIKKLRLESKRYDLIHSQFGSACSLVSALSVKNKPLLLTLRGSDWYRIKNGFSLFSFHGLLANLFTKISLRHFDGVICVSRRMQAEVAEFVHDKRVFYLPDPIDLDVFKPINKKKVRLKLGLEKDIDKKWVLFTSVSKTNPVKRFDLAKNAFEIANRKCGDLELCLASGIDHSLMPEFVGACDLILLTSTHEGWPNCVKEALACDIPFVCTNVSDLQEISTLEPSCRVCPPDPIVIAENICEVLSENGQARLRHHVFEMSLPNACKQIEKIYEEILSGKMFVSKIENNLCV